MKIMTLIFCVFIVIILVWLVGFFFINDFSVPNSSIDKYKKILIIYPHADDEVLGTAGLINIANRKGKDVTFVILTKGENGTPDGKTNLQLKEIRTKEAKTVSKYLGVSKLIQEDFGDGKLNEKKKELFQYISELIKQENADLVITYDTSGLYGHADHIIVSEIVTDLIKNEYKESDLWYTTYPKRVLSMASLPEHMATDEKFKERRVVPSNKLFIGTRLLKKIQSVYLYKSQYQSFRDGVPVKLVPLWFFYSMSWYEYYYQVNVD